MPEKELNRKPAEYSVTLTKDKIESLEVMQEEALLDVYDAAEKVFLIKNLLNGGIDSHYIESVFKSDVPDGFTQLLVPNEILEKAGIEPDDPLEFTADDGFIIIGEADFDCDDYEDCEGCPYYCSECGSCCCVDEPDDDDFE